MKTNYQRDYILELSLRHITTTTKSASGRDDHSVKKKLNQVRLVPNLGGGRPLAVLARARQKIL